MEPNIFQQKGYTWMALPLPAVLPLMLLQKNEDNIFMRIKEILFGAKPSATPVAGDIFMLFPHPGRGTRPSRSRPRPAPFLQGTQGLKLNTGAAGQLKGKVPLASAATNIKINSVDNLIYRFENLTETGLADELALEQYVNQVRPLEGAPGIIESLNAGKMYAIMSVLQCTAFSISKAGESAVKSNIDAKTTGDTGNINVSLDTTSDFDQKMVYEKHEEPVTIAIKAAKILFENNIYRISKKPLNIVRGDNNGVVDYFDMPDDIIEAG